MSTYAYEEILNDVVNRVQNLPPDEQEQLLDDLAKLLRRRVTQRPKHNVMEFRGAAKDFWKDIDVKKFIEEERNSWDG
jgi:hypothetical protein